MVGTRRTVLPATRTRRALPIAQPARLRIATIDRDVGFLRALAERTRRIEWTLIVHQGPVTAATLLGGRPHAVLVDIGLLGPYWEDWLVRHPAHVPDLGVLICTGRSTLAQRVRGLRAGADDWLTKPCDPEEVIARLQAIIRAYRLRLAGEDHMPLRCGGIELRPDALEVFAGGRAAGLTRREFDVLAHLARHAGVVVRRERLYEEVWGYTMARGSRSVDTLVRKIRNKLAHISPDWLYVHTHKGVGYRFAPEHVRAAPSRRRCSPDLTQAVSDYLGR